MDSPQRLNGVTPPTENTSTRRTVSITITARTLWMAVGIVVALLVGAILITQALSTFIALLLAIILGEAIRPMVARLQRYRIPGPLAVLIIYIVVLAIVAFLLWLLLNPLISQVTTLANDLPGYLAQLRQRGDDLRQFLNAQGALSQFITSLSSSLASLAQQAIPRLLAVPLSLLTGVFGLFINVVVVLTMALFWLMASEKLRPFVVGLFPEGSQDHVASVLTEIGRGFGGYIRGTLISMVLIGALSGAGLAILNVPYALLLGLLAGLTELLPFLGPWISGSVAVVVALITVDPVKAIEVIVLFFVVFEVEGNLIQPLVMSRSVHVDPLLVIVAVLVGINLLGIIGAILAVPIVAAAQILIVRVLAPYIRRNHPQPVTAVVTTESTAPPTVSAQDHPVVEA